MVEHTPGPWVAVEEPYDPENDLFCRSIYSEGYKGLLIARADQDFSHKNARLIAAAPELLAELKRLSVAYVSLMETGRDRIVQLGGDCDPVDVMEAGNPWLRAAREVIAKAEGRSASTTPDTAS